MCVLFLTILLCGTARKEATAQETINSDSLREIQLEPLTIESTRLNQMEDRVPLAVTVIKKQRLQLGQPQLSSKDILDAIPGVYSSSPSDLRVSIRGFGARSAFGIRGVKVLVDGFPESTPDGQAQFDNVDIGIVDRVEVLRGPSSVLYGNASGGVIRFKTEEPTERPSAELRTTFGSYGLQRYQLKHGMKVGNFSYQLYGSHRQSDGYREYSASENTLLNGKFRYQFDSTASVSLLLNYSTLPMSQSPGGVNLETVNEDRSQARDRNLLFKAGGDVSQSRVGVIANKSFGNHTFQGKIFQLNRDLYASIPVPFNGIITFDRTFNGGGFSHTYEANNGFFTIKTGVDVEDQTDDRVRFANNEGEAGDMVLDQEENFLDVGVYSLAEIFPAPNFSITAGLRYDYVEYGANDNFLDNGDDTGSSSFNPFNPLLGVTWTPVPAVNVYANYSTSFETPTLNELSNNPTLDGGFNEDLRPLQARNYELGVKGWANGKLRYEFTLYRINVTDEITRFQIDDSNNSFFQNAGETQRNGVELGMGYEFAPGLQAFANYAYSDFTYVTFQDGDDNFANNDLPGIPRHQGYGEIRYNHRAGFYGIVTGRYNGELFADNANEVLVERNFVTNLRTGWQFKISETLGMEVFGGVNNLFSVDYFSNIAVNAFGGRYYSAAPPINFYGGLSLRLN